jgi:hypothetical protein
LSSAPALVGIAEDHRYHIRTRRWLRYRRELAGFLIDILCTLVSEGATGRLLINFNQGGAASVEFEERECLDDDSS